MYSPARGGRVAAMHKTTLLTSLAATAATALAFAGPAAAAAKPVPYKGKTDAGTKVTFERVGDEAQLMLTYLPTACVSSRTSDTKAGSESFNPYPLRIGGGEQTLTVENQSSSLGYSSVSKNYRATLTKGPKGVVRGKLHVNYMVVDPMFNAMGYLDGNTFICQAEGTFTAKPVKKKRRK
jgi:hypothetical protein